MRKPWDFEEPLCAEVGSEIFFARDTDETEYTSSSTRTYQDAKKICEMCTHKMECAEWGIVNETHGVWGGLTPVERNTIRRRSRITVVPKERFIL